MDSASIRMVKKFQSCYGCIVLDDICSWLGMVMGSQRFGLLGIEHSTKKITKLLRKVQKQLFASFLSLITCSIALVLLWSTPVLPAFAVDYNKESLAGADFSGRVLTDASFNQADLRESNFSRSDLRGVSFFGAHLESANLEGADLRSATLDRARLTRANLTNANLEGAFAFNATFKGAVIDGADFTDVDVRQDAQAILCKAAKGTNPVTGRETRETLNCP